MFGNARTVAIDARGSTADQRMDLQLMDLQECVQ